MVPASNAIPVTPTPLPSSSVFDRGTCPSFTQTLSTSYNTTVSCGCQQQWQSSDVTACDNQAYQAAASGCTDALFNLAVQAWQARDSFVAILYPLCLPTDLTTTKVIYEEQGNLYHQYLPCTINPGYSPAPGPNGDPYGGLPQNPSTTLYVTAGVTCQFDITITG
jgi:hypothetical protein